MKKQSACLRGHVYAVTGKVGTASRYCSVCHRDRMRDFYRIKARTEGLTTIPNLGPTMDRLGISAYALQAASGVHRNSIYRARKGHPITVRNVRRITHALARIYEIDRRRREMGLC